MNKLWQKGYELNEVIERFTVGDDYILDRELIEFDCYGSIAHAAMLAKIGILTAHEFQSLHNVLVRYAKTPGSLKILVEDEDVHTALEHALCAEVGEAGKKIHTARSRNDQVLVDVRLYARDQLLLLMRELITCMSTLHAFAEQHAYVPLVGRTHFQKAMPSSIGLWMGALAESLLDDLELIKAAYALINQCPLGSAASYGTPLPIDRQLVSDLLGFDKVQNNVLYANNSRGKFESIILHALVQVMTDMSKYATDIILFSTPEFGYFNLPQELCSGSSLMPQKRNPCMLELVRAKTATVTSCLTNVLDIIKALPTGYNRDFQETKRPFMLGLKTTRDAITVFTLVIKGMTVNEDVCKQAFTSEVCATDEALALIKEGIPFRDAYKKIALNLGSLAKKHSVLDFKSMLAQRTQIGATGNLGLEHIAQRMVAEQVLLAKNAKQHESVCENLKTIKLEEYL